MNQELNTYIQNSLTQGESVYIIRKTLLEKGWKLHEIDNEIHTLRNDFPHIRKIEIIKNLLHTTKSLLIIIFILFFFSLFWAGGCFPNRSIKVNYRVEPNSVPSCLNIKAGSNCRGQLELEISSDCIASYSYEYLGTIEELMNHERWLKEYEKNKNAVNTIRDSSIPQIKGTWLRELYSKEDPKNKVVIYGENVSPSIISSLSRNIHYIFLFYLVCQYIVLRLLKNKYDRMSLLRER